MKTSVLLTAALTVIGVASVTVISGCAEAPPAQAGRMMTGEEIKNLFNGRSEETTNSEGGSTERTTRTLKPSAGGIPVQTGRQPTSKRA